MNPPPFDMVVVSILLFKVKDDLVTENILDNLFFTISVASFTANTVAAVVALVVPLCSKNSVAIGDNANLRSKISSLLFPLLPTTAVEF